jgi:hypothetical protein
VLVDVEDRPLDDFWNVRVENAAYALLESDGNSLTLRAECVTDHLANARADVTAQAL